MISYCIGTFFFPIDLKKSSLIDNLFTCEIKTK